MIIRKEPHVTRSMHCIFSIKIFVLFVGVLLNAPVSATLLGDDVIFELTAIQAGSVGVVFSGSSTVTDPGSEFILSDLLISPIVPGEIPSVDLIVDIGPSSISFFLTNTTPFDGIVGPSTLDFRDLDWLNGPGTITDVILVFSSLTINPIVLFGPDSVRLDTFGIPGYSFVAPAGSTFQATYDIVAEQ